MNSIESDAQYSGKTIATGSGPRYYFNLFIASVTDKPETKGFLATVEGTPYQHFPVDKTNIGGGETIDLSKVQKIEIIPAPREEAEAFINKFYNTIRIYLTDGEVISAKRGADLFIVTESGRNIRLSSRNANHLILLRTK
jgi:hypothetical protein